jgi:WD40 repeat protein
MSPSAIPPSTAHSAMILRTYGARPFRTDGDLLALSFAPDGSLVSVEEPGELRRWDVAAKQQTAWHLLDDAAMLWCFNADGSLLASGGDDLMVWDAGTGEVVFRLRQSSWVTAVAFSPDGKQMATGHDDCIVRLWDVEDRQQVRQYRGHERAVSALAFSPDGWRLASAGEDKLIRLWDVDVARFEPAGTLEGHTDRIPALAWHPDCKRLFSAGWDTTARVWDVAKCEPIILLNAHTGQVQALALSADGRTLACSDSANTVHVWDANKYRELTVLPEQAGEVRCLAFQRAGGLLAAGGAERTIHLWDAKRGADEEKPADPLVARTCLAVSSDGKRLASLGAETTLRVWDVATGATSLELSDSGPLRAFAASPNGRWFVGSLADESVADPVRLWDAVTGERRIALDGQKPPITALAFALDSTILASAGYLSGDVWLWKIPSGDPALILPDAADGCSVEGLAFHPNGRLLAVSGIDWLATSGSDGRIALWDVATRQRTALLQGGASSLAFNPAGTLLAAASLALSVRVWDVATGRRVAELIGHLDAVHCVAFSPDGRLLASAGDDHTVRLWDLSSWEEVAVAHLDSQVKALAFSTDGRFFFTGNGNTSCYQLAVDQVLAEGP